MDPSLLFAALVLFAVFIVGVRHVPDHRVMALRRLGRYRRTLGPGWHWTIPVLDRAGAEVALIGHHLVVHHTGSGEDAELHYQITDAQKAGATLECIDAWISAQAREALSQADHTPDQLRNELNRRAGQLGLRVVRCSLQRA